MLLAISVSPANSNSKKNGGLPAVIHEELCRVEIYNWDDSDKLSAKSHVDLGITNGDLIASYSVQVISGP